MHIFASKLPSKTDRFAFGWQAFAAIWIVALLSGCASTTRAVLPPLESDGAQFDAAAQLAISTDASIISRPWLRPTPIDLAQPLDSNAISLVAVIANPDLRALRKRADIADAQVYAAGLLPGKHTLKAAP